jgi:hypothetical protein
LWCAKQDCIDERADHIELEPEHFQKHASTIALKSNAQYASKAIENAKNGADSISEESAHNEQHAQLRQQKI